MEINFDELRARSIAENLDWKELKEIYEQHDIERLAKIMAKVNPSTEYTKTSFDCRVDLKDALDRYVEKHDTTKKAVINGALELFLVRNK